MVTGSIIASICSGGAVRTIVLGKSVGISERLVNGGGFLSSALILFLASSSASSVAVLDGGVSLYFTLVSSLVSSASDQVKLCSGGCPYLPVAAGGAAVSS